MIDPQAWNRLAKALDLPPAVCSLRLYFDAGQPAMMTVERLLTAKEVEALAEWYETEGLTQLPAGETTYNLVKKQQEQP